MEDVLERYEELYEDMATSGNKEKMTAFGDAERWAFRKMNEISPKDAQCWLDKLEAMHWKNYLSKHEADEITSKLINQNGRIGAHWNYDTFKGAVESLGGKMYEKPYYNCYALWATANMIYSDHAQSVAEDMGMSSPEAVPNEKMALSMYKKAVEQLKDTDRPKFVREYFDL
jgi:hypothetical protein